MGTVRKVNMNYDPYTGITRICDGKIAGLLTRNVQLQAALQPYAACAGSTSLMQPAHADRGVVIRVLSTRMRHHGSCQGGLHGLKRAPAEKRGSDHSAASLAARMACLGA